MMTFHPDEIQALRKETAATRDFLHFNNAGAALMPDVVRDAQLAYTAKEAAIGGYEAMAYYEAQLSHFYEAAAALVNASPREIAFTESATAAWQKVMGTLQWQRGDVILTAMAEYATNYINYLQLKARYGVEVQAVPNDAHGQLDVEALESMLSPAVKLIAITHIPTNGGLINPAIEVGEVARAHGVPYLLDACQSVGQIPVDVEEIGCDFLSATGRKYLRGPRGSGFLYVSEQWLAKADHEPEWLDLHSAQWQPDGTYKVRRDAKRYEHFERSYAAQYALGVAIDYALSIGMERIGARVTALAQQLREGLAALEGVTVHDLGRRKGGIVSFSIEGGKKMEIVKALHAQGVNISPIFRNGTLLDSEARGLGDELMRASVHYYNTEAEVERFVEVIGGFVPATLAPKEEA